MRYEAGSQSVGGCAGGPNGSGRRLLDDRARDLERTAVTEQTQLNVLMNRDAFAGRGRNWTTSRRHGSDPPVEPIAGSDAGESARR